MCVDGCVQVLLRMTLRCADLAFAARPQPIYLRWMDRMMEEFFYQGDLEKQLGLPVSPFWYAIQPICMLSLSLSLSLSFCLSLSLYVSVCVCVCVCVQRS